MSKRMVCPRCNGTCRITCPDCIGSSDEQQKCQKCGGEGLTFCIYCNGTGQVSKHIVDGEKLTKEAKMWDSGELTPKGWIGAPEAVPIINAIANIFVGENKIAVKNLLMKAANECEVKKDIDE